MKTRTARRGRGKVFTLPRLFALLGVLPARRPPSRWKRRRMLRRNRDVVGWLQYPVFSKLDFAVVQRDNAYYLDHAVSGEKTWPAPSS